MASGLFPSTGREDPGASMFGIALVVHRPTKPSSAARQA